MKGRGGISFSEMGYHFCEELDQWPKGGVLLAHKLLILILKVDVGV